MSLLLIRFVAGSAFMFHGWRKIQSPLSWMGPESDIPAIFQLLAALSEFGGGMAWILGLLTPVASFGIGCTMIVATYLHMVVRKDPFVSYIGSPSYELALVFFSVSMILLALGPGRFSFDRFLFGQRDQRNMK